MKKKNQISQINFFSTPHTPIPFSSFRTSPIPYTKTTQPSLNTYKSPNSTPTPPNTQNRPSIDSYFQSSSDQKTLKPADSLSKLKVKLKLKEKQIQILEEENKKLSKTKSSANWEKELVKRNGEVRKLEALVVHFRDLLAQNADSFKLLQIIETQSARITELEMQLESRKAEKIGDYQKYVQCLEIDNRMLKKTLSSQSLTVDSYETLQNKLESLEKNYKTLYKEKIDLSDQLTKLKTENSPNSLLNIMQDICRIRKEVSKLLRIVKDIHKGKEISLKGLLGIEQETFSEPSLQLHSDVQRIKSDLNQISTILSDFHANQCAELVCKTH